MQIRTRLTWQFFLTVAALLALTLGFVYYRFKRSQEDEFYRGLRFKAEMTAKMVLRQEDKIIFPAEEPTSEALFPLNDAVVIYNDRQEKVFAVNPGAAALPQATFDGIKELGECRITYSNLPALGIRHKSAGGNTYIVVAASVFQSEELKKLRNILMLSLLIAVALAALGGWFFAGRAMAPVSKVINEVERILPSNLSTRLPSSENNDEIGRLAATFNGLLDRIYFAFQMQKRFISNVSHELKNPVSVVISQIEVTLDRDRSKEEYQETLQSVLDDTRNMADMTEKLLQMARVYSDDSNIALALIRLDELVLNVRESLLRARPEYHIYFELDAASLEREEPWCRGNEALLRLAVANLIDNGCKFAPDKTVRVQLSADAVSRQWVLTISDKGPGIPEVDLPLVFQPFYRGAQQAKAPGSGIGLSLVESILKLHQAQISVQSAPGEGVVMRLVFPPNL